MSIKLLFLPFIFTFYKVTKGDFGIMGGTPALIEDYPYQAGLHYKNNYHCGASLVSTTFILTAAHCVEKMDKTKLKIQAGSSYSDRDQEFRDVDEIIIHEKYNRKTALQYDIALVRLKNAYEENERIRVIPLIKKNTKLAIDSLGVVTGFGKETNNLYSKQLRKIIIPVVTELECKRIITKHFSECLYCAGKIDGNMKVCKGDSGGPMAINGVLVGVIHGSTHCVPNSKGTTAFVNISHFKEWIDDNMKPKNYYAYNLV